MGIPGQGAMRATWQNLTHCVSLLPPNSNYTVCAIGPAQLPMTTLSMVMGGHVRVGLEDNIYYSKGELAKSNAQMVERTVRQANELQRPIASPAEAREIMGLKALEM